MNQSITVSAPGKLMLLGDHAVVYENPCLVTAVDQRMFVTVTLLEEPVFTLDAPDVGISDYQRPMSELGHGDIPKGARFVELAIRNVLLTAKSKPSGIHVKTRSEFSSSFGFGSSSASTVCVAAALSELCNLHLSNKKLFDIAYKTVLDIQGAGSGFDVAAGIYGGTIYFVGGGRVIEPIVLSALPLIVGYSGIKGDTAQMISQVAKRRGAHIKMYEELFQISAGLVDQGKSALQAGDFESLGHLFEAGEELMFQYGVEIEKLKQMISAACGAGAWGAKMSGAGGGDCMIALAPPTKRASVEAAIKKAGGEVIHLTTHAAGVRVEQ